MDGTWIMFIAAFVVAMVASNGAMFVSAWGWPPGPIIEQNAPRREKIVGVIACAAISVLFAAIMKAWAVSTGG